MRESSDGMTWSVERKDGAIFIAVDFAETLDREQIDRMAQIVEDAIATTGELRLLLNMSETRHYDASAFTSPDGALASLKSIGPVERYGVVGPPKIAEAAIEAFGKVLPLEARTFEPHELAEARAWALAAGFP